jgi:hypothetical protein
MAKIKSSIIIKGTIDGITYYMLNGKYVARKAGGGFNSKDIKTKSSMVKVGENSTEFGHCSEVKSVFRKALNPYLKTIRVQRLHSDMVSMFTEIKKCDTVSERGTRTVDEGLKSLEGKAVLESYAYPDGYSVSEVLGNRFVMNWDTFHCVCPDFNTSYVTFPASATHVGLLFGVVAMDFTLLMSETFLAEEFFVSRTTATPSIDLTTLEVPAKIGRRIGVLGIRFYQEVNGTYHALEAKRGFAVLGME